MTFDEAVDQLKKDIRAERFFDSLAAKPKPPTMKASGSVFEVWGFWLIIGWAVFTYLG